jgi:heme/copper-type cytochrome/quinol oxidase subunit 4
MHLKPLQVWISLVAATLISWVVTEDTIAVKFGATAVVLIAAFKINLVVSHFMELKWQPRPFRIVISGWLTLVTTIIIGGYWAA